MCQVLTSKFAVVWSDTSNDKTSSSFIVSEPELRISLVSLIFFDCYHVVFDLASNVQVVLANADNLDFLLKVQVWILGILFLLLVVLPYFLYKFVVFLCLDWIYNSEPALRLEDDEAAFAPPAY